MRKLIAALICVFAMFVMLYGAQASAELKIVTTDFICYDFARAVFGTDARIDMLIRPGMEVHTYDPTPSDILKISECDLFIYIGGESDSWVENILDSFEDNAPESLKLIDTVDVLEEEKTEEMTVHESGETEEGPEYDEHIWTSPRNAILMLRAIEEAAKTFGDYSADAYIGEIEAIDAEIREIVSHAARNTIVFADRFPLLYFVREYGLEYKAAFPSCNAESDPAARTVAALIDIVRNEKIPVIYILETNSGRLASIIAEETKTKVLRYYSIQTITLKDFDAGENYITLMRRNIEALREGLE